MLRSTARRASLSLSLSLSLLLAGCVEPADDEIGADELALTDTVPTAAGAHQLAFEVASGQQRAYLLYLPAGYDQNRAQPYPVVAMFHGFTGSAAGFAATLDAAGLRTLADQQGKIVVFLQGTVGLSITSNGFWNVTAAGRDDVGYTQELLDHLSLHLNVDEDRVFAGGHSLGGRFVHELGSRDPDRFRALADVSGFYGTPFAQPAAPPAGTLLPVLIVHGTDDMTVPPAGGPLFLPTQSTYAAWYANNACTEPTNLLLSIFWAIETTDCLPGITDPVVQYVLVGGLQHNWPTAADHYDASSEMLAFFDMQ